MGLYRQPGCRIWYMRYSVDGKLYRRSTGKTNKEEAARVLREAKNEIDAGGNPAKGALLVFDELMNRIIDDYKMNHRKSLNTIRHRMKHLQLFFGHKKVKQITPAAIRRYIVKRQDLGANDATINRELAILRRALKLAGIHGTVERTKGLKLKEHPKQMDAFRDRTEFEKFRDSLPEYLRPLVSFGCITGWRLNTLLNLKWEHVEGVDASSSDVTVTAPSEIMKNGEPLTITFRAIHEGARILRNLSKKYTSSNDSQVVNIGERRKAIERRQAICPYVFDRRGKQIRDISYAWNRACQAIGVRGYRQSGSGRQITFHSLRRTAITEMLRRSVPVPYIQKIVGHRTPEMINHYQQLLQDDIKNVFDVMEQAR